MINHPHFQNGNIYLSGGMEKTSSDDPLGAKWRIKVSEQIKQMGFFPLDIAALDRAYTDAHGDLYHSFDSDEQHLLQMKSNVRKHFVETDLQLIIKDSDAVILYYDDSVRKGAGTISEAQISFNEDIPLFVVNAYQDLTELPGWLKALSTKIFNTFDELYVYLRQLPPKILKRDVYGNHHGGDQYLCSLCGTVFHKHKTHFVSKISPLYCGSCVDVVKTTFEQQPDRYQFFVEHLQKQAERETNE